jgi:alkylation response protein AidB-like acyl-CoA dehydrogenase
VTHGLTDGSRAAIERIARRAATADAEAVFPDETVADLATGGLLRAVLPVADGGLGLDDARFCDVAMALGAACLSTAYVWVMHCQQADAVFRHGSPPVRAAARRVVEDGGLLCSVTTERPGADSLYPGIDSVVTALEPGREPGSWALRREAPVVSAARHAGGFLATAARPGSRAVELVWVPGSAVVDGPAGLRACPPLAGLRATGNQSLVLACTGTDDDLVGGPGGFSGAVKARWSRFAHLGWAASWLGAAAHVVEEATGAAARRRAARRRAVGAVPQAALARTVWDLEAVAGVLDRHRRALARADGAADVEDTVRSNVLKVGASETCFRVVDDVVAQVGAPALTPGTAIERHWRDLRMTALVTRNDALLVGAGGLLGMRAHALRLDGDR